MSTGDLRVDQLLRDIDWAIVWDTVDSSLPELIEAIAPLLGSDPL